MTIALTEEIQVPDRPTVPGLRFRHFRGAADFAGMAAANQAHRDAAGIEQAITAEGMAIDYAHLTNSDLDQDALIVERDGAIVGYARVEWRERIAGTRGFASICALRPSER
ncbi:MAG TPA: hypothetical protein VM408_06705, partial [Methylomirabilota bacterium]|nr:hypothetical protein [Methylomirabilota bacterium]